MVAKNGFVKLPQPILRLAGIHDGCRLSVYALARAHARPGRDDVFRGSPGVRNVAAAIGRSGATVKDALAWLERAGALTRRRQFGAPEVLTFRDLVKGSNSSCDQPKNLTFAAARSAGKLDHDQPENAPRSARKLAINYKEQSKKKPKITPQEDGTHSPDANGFTTFWAAFPRKVAQAAASKAWYKLKPDPALRAQILAALELQRRSEQWTRDGGRFIPYASTWINGRRWEDELEPAPPRRNSRSPDPPDVGAQAAAPATVVAPKRDKAREAAQADLSRRLYAACSILRENATDVFNKGRSAGLSHEQIIDGLEARVKAFKAKRPLPSSDREGTDG